MSFKWQKTTINTPNGTVEAIAPIIISASRATDIPAFYADWFMHRVSYGTQSSYKQNHHGSIEV